VAKHHRISREAVSHWVCRLRKNPKLFSEMISKQEEVEQDKAKVKAYVTAKLGEFDFVDSAEDVRREVQAQYQLKLPVRRVRAILSKDMGLRWRKIKKIGLAENSTRNLILR
jgi:hypothetical protein